MTRAVDGLPDRAFARGALWATLLRHEWRLTWRAFWSKSPGRGTAKPRKVRSRAWTIASVVLAFVGIHVLGLLALALPRTWDDGPRLRVASLFVLVFLFTLMLSFAMSRVVAAFHERRDLDLMLTAPVDPVLLLAIRVATVVAAVTATFAFFTWPFIDVAVASGRWWMARVYALVPVLAIAATGIALMVADGFVRAVGVRRARVGLQVFSALTGAAAYLVTQAHQFLGKEATDRWIRSIVAQVERVDAMPPVAFALGIASGSAIAWAVLVPASVALLAIAVVLARRRFADVAREAESGATVGRASPEAVARRIGRGFAVGAFAAIVRKEWRLILRAPQLVAQILMQLLYLLPLMFVAFGQSGLRANWSNAALAAGIVGIASTLTTSLAWLSVSGEDAPDLMAGSPRAPGELLAAKLVAAASPPLVLVATAAAGIAGRAPVDALLLLAYGLAGATSAAILAAALDAPGRRSDFQRRHQGRGLYALVEGVQFLLWASSAGLATQGLWIAAAATTVLGLVAPAFRLRAALARMRGR